MTNNDEPSHLLGVLEGRNHALARPHHRESFGGAQVQRLMGRTSEL